jgi:hypothetical protein
MSELKGIWKEAVMKILGPIPAFPRRSLEQVSECTYNLTLRWVRGPIVAVEKQCHLFRVFVCGLGYPACTARAPYYILICGLSALFYSLKVSYKGHNFRKKRY